jgi:cobalt-zinc-cadmium resistance protein CzcA
LSQPLFAQTPISLRAAIDTALHNNLQVKNEQLKARYQEALVGTASNLPQINFMAEAGQINSIYTDTKFSLSQSFSFPSVYTKQKALLQEEFKWAVLNVALKEAQLKKDLTQVYYSIVYLEQKSQLLNYTDSLYRSFFKRAEQRLAKGETNLLEKTSAETQLGQIGIQLKQIAQDQSVLLLQFQLLLNSTMAYKPSKADYRLSYQGIMDSALLKEHPSLKLIQQQQQMAEAQIGIEKSKKLPELSVGYNNTSIKGMGADNVLYGSGQRFSSVQLGIGIPIFAKSQNNRIAGAKLNKQVAESNYQIGVQSLENAYLAANLQYQKNLETLKYFEEQALKNASLITNTANQQLAAGSINYLEWFQLINQATIVRSEHIDAIRNLNESIIQLNFISNK